MTTVKMKCTVCGYPDGFTRNFYQTGEVYEIPEKLAECFLEGNVAEIWNEKEESELDPEEKNLGNAPENKAYTEAPENKSGEDEREQSGKPSKKGRPKK